MNKILTDSDERPKEIKKEKEQFQRCNKAERLECFEERKMFLRFCFCLRGGREW